MSAITESSSGSIYETLLHGSKVLLVATVWLSALLFGLHILAFYIMALSQGELSIWNHSILPDLYKEDAPVATAGIGLHFAMGAIILILGSIQLITKVRTNFPQVHRWIGRIYVTASILTAIGGLTFIVVGGTVGGTVMDIGFGLYGILMLVCGIETFRHARAGRIEIHNHWAWRLYALAIGSWLYRMEYGFWFALMGRTGHSADFTGPFDYFMDFFFYIPNLIVAEYLIRAKQHQSSPQTQVFVSMTLVFAASIIMIATHAFVTRQWGPSIWAAIA
ncbi:MAG: DUF2306 domain-containing protein [Pseudomonadota bacterium]